MNLKNWREALVKVYKQHCSRCVALPFIMANEMGIEDGNYLIANYDEKSKSITLTKKEN